VKISCPACAAKYSITDDKVQDRLAKIRCRKCGATIVIDGKAQPPHVYTSSGEGTEAAEASEPSNNNVEYSVDFGEGDQRTLVLKDVVTAYKAGEVTSDTYVWAEGFSDWKPLGEVSEIVEALNAAPAAASPSPWENKAAAAEKPAAAAGGAFPRAAARATSRAAGSADLFGRIESAGSEDDVSTSAPEQPSPLATPSASAGTGARNESSVLFSLSALTSAAQNQPARSSSANGASRDDSGLIDLKALTAAAMKNDATGAPPPVAPAFAPATPAPLGVAAPLGFNPPLGSPVGLGSLGDVSNQPRSKAPLYIGGGLAVGLMALAAAYLLKPVPPPPPPAPVIVQAPAAPAPVAAAPEAPAAEAVPKAPATGTPEEKAPDGTTPKKRYTGGAAPKKSGGGATEPTKSSGGSAAPAAEKPAPKRSACGCASGDLQCAMRCAAKGG